MDTLRIAHRLSLIQSLRQAIATVSSVADAEDIRERLVNAHDGLNEAEQYLTGLRQVDAAAAPARMKVVDALTDLARAKVEVAWALFEAEERSVH